MKQSQHFLDNAENCAQLAERATDDPTHKRYKRMEAAWRALAEEQDWLDGEVSPVRMPAMARDEKLQRRHEIRDRRAPHPSLRGAAATKQSSFLLRQSWIASLSLAMTDETGATSQLTSS